MIPSDFVSLTHTPVDQNGSYAVAVSTQPNAKNCIVTSGSGSGVTANVTVVAVAFSPSGQWAYVVSSIDNTIT
jgi:hypothetical protein